MRECKEKSDRISSSGIASSCVVTLVACLGIGVAAPAAQADDFAFGRRLFLDKAQCLYCHGWAGDGAGEPQSNGAAANLRVTPLKRDQLIEVISCGVPGKAMPHFDEQAYTDKRCYGVAEADLGSSTPALPPGSTLSKREIEAVADYLLAKVIGRGPVITGEECEEAYGDGARQCVILRSHDAFAPEKRWHGSNSAKRPIST